MRGLTGHGEDHERLVKELEDALRRLAGVNWAGVNAALGQVLVDFDEDRLGPDEVLKVIERVEEAHGTDADAFPAGRPQPPFSSAPATLAATALAADCLGLMTATIRRVAMRPALSPALRIPTVMAELQPRVRGLLESRLGRAHADALIGVSNAVVHALTRGEAPLALDALQRVLQLAEIRGRQVVWQRREPELVADGDGLPARSHPPTPRPAPLPSGPVETCVDRTSLASLSGAGGLLAWTGDLAQSAKALLATVPKAAAMGREAFAARLGDVLARDGVVPMDGTALRLLDRVSAVLIDSRVLCAGRPRLLSVTTVGDLGEAEAWSAAQSVLDRRTLREVFFAGLTTAPVRTVAAEELRVGDIIALRPSDVVPADARLLVSDRLELDEAGLTGESGPVTKDPAATPGADLADRSCMLYQGCTVLAGTGYAVVVAAGAQTEAGRAAELAGRATAPIGIEGRLAALTKVALPATGLGGAAVTLLGLLHGVPVREALSTGVAIAVAAVPEGLPLVATVAQSAAARRLSHRGVLTRSARVLEALGRVDVVCFDKTGTLTEGRLAVARVAGYDQELPTRGALGKRLLRTAARACPEPEGGRALAHATDQAVIDAAAAHCDGDGAWRPVSELPFEASRGFSACLGTQSGRPQLAVKGAPEIVLARCAHALNPGAADDTVPLTPERRRATERLLYSLASDGLRVLAVAETRPAASDTPTAEVADIARELTLLGFIAIADTTRPGAAETVKRLTDAGVRVAMVTGDHPTTAVAIARELGIPDAEPVLTGAELDTLPEGERVERISRATVFARVSPEHKVRIVQALRQAGQVVAMTGDGVNDTAAIRLADIGIGLSAHGSASARAAADLVLTDPDPTRILDALREGRALWRSVRDAVAILVGGNAGEVAFTLLGAAVAGRAPLGTRQLLLVNLLTDMLPALAVALARAREHKSGEDPLADGPSSALFGSDLGRILAVRGSATALGAAAAWQCGRMTGRARRASTMGLAALVGTQLGQTYLTDWHSPLVLITSVASAATLFAIVETPVVSHFFGCTPLGPMAWLIVGGCSAAATVGAALAPRLLFPRRVPLAV
ncbi:HAD-IC family P-type ATPase [Streptomyces sp. NEAU-174]|uniref:HAD-IC family P-type ATPase n=1 Tax=Streptomyces sp. NEAU-174 TaxID=3458254 RepID=UPI004044BD84